MKRAHAWPLAIAAVLGLTVIANIALLVAANAPGAAQVEPDYYRRALAWDSTQAERARSVALGWRATARFVPRAEHAAALVVELRDAAGRAVTGATLEAVAIHNLELQAPLRCAPREVAPGTYRADVVARHAGRWEIQIEATQGRDRFAAVLHAELAAPTLANARTELAR